jgi:U3 small nucleolar RNA-associated protein 14
VVVAVGLTAKKIQKEVLSHSTTYEVPVERAIQDIAERKVTVTLRI